MTLGIDIDNTITMTTKLANFYLNQDTSFSKVNDYHKLNQEEYLKFCAKYLEKVQREVELFPNVVEVLNDLKEKGVKIIIITARGSLAKRSMAITKEYLENKNIPYDKIYFLQESKVWACQKENVDVFIDDKEIILDEIKSKGMATIRFYPIDKSKHEVAYTWIDVKKILEKRLENGKNN